jgi:uroporphyrinogen decarboxylase
VGSDDQVSYKHHREYEFPYIAGLVKAVKGPVAIRGADDWSHVLDSYAEAGVEGFYAFSGQSLDKAKEWSIRHNTMLRYGVNAQLLVHGPKEKIREEVKRIITVGAPGGHFCIATDALDYSTPAEHVDVFMEAAKEYGQLPLKI